MEAVSQDPPYGGTIVDRDTCIELDLHTVTVTDQLGNAFERKLLIESGIFAPSQGATVEVGANPDSLFSERVSRELEQAAKAQLAARSNEAVEVGLPNLVSLAKSVLRDKLRASYELKVEVTPHLFDAAQPSGRKFDHSIKFVQTTLGNPITAATDAHMLLFRGKAGDIMAISIQLVRDSLISRLLSDQLASLRASTFFADAFETALMATPLGSYGSKAGKTIGSWLDDAVYDEVAARTAPTVALATARYSFISRLGEQKPRDAQKAWYTGDRSFWIDAIVEQAGVANTADAAGPRVTVLKFSLTTTEIRQ